MICLSPQVIHEKIILSAVTFIVTLLIQRNVLRPLMSF